MGIFKAMPLRATERTRTGPSTYWILTAPVGAVMEGQLKTLAAHKAQGCGSVCACVFVCVCIHLVINYHQYTCLRLQRRVKLSSLCLFMWVYVYYCGVVLRPCVSSKALLKCFPWNSETVSDLAISPTETAGAVLPSMTQVLSRAARALATTGVISRGGRQEVLIMRSAHCIYLRAVCWKRAADLLFTLTEEWFLFRGWVCMFFSFSW